MSATHTPGPWEATERHGYREILGPRNSANWFGQKDIWAVAYCDTDLDEAEQDANARLIAAAPDLLAAASEALAEISALRDWVDHHVPSHLIPSEDWGRLHRPIVTAAVAKNLRAAIARATPTAEGVA